MDGPGGWEAALWALADRRRPAWGISLDTNPPTTARSPLVSSSAAPPRGSPAHPRTTASGLVASRPAGGHTGCSLRITVPVAGPTGSRSSLRAHEAGAVGREECSRPLSLPPRHAASPCAHVPCVPARPPASPVAHLHLHLHLGRGEAHLDVSGRREMYLAQGPALDSSRLGRPMGCCPAMRRDRCVFIYCATPAPYHARLQIMLHHGL